MKRTVSGCLGIMALTSVGCMAELDEEPMATAQSKLVDSGSYLYLRCNATGWGVDSRNRMVPGSASELLAIDYEVGLPWMITGSDTCTFVTTNQLDAWGTRQTFFDKGGSQLLEVPPTGAGYGQLLVSPPGNDYHFGVRYPELGRYTATVNLANGTFWIESAKPQPKVLKVAVYVPEVIDSCFIGDPCTGDNCVGLRNDDNVLTEAFTDGSFRSVRTDDPAVSSALKSICLNMSLDGTALDEIDRELSNYHARVAEWSHGNIQLDLRKIRIPHANLNESRWGIGVWIGPWDLSEVATPQLDFVPDFNLVIPPIRDPMRQLHHDLGGCGGTYGADLGLAGAGWSWVPKTRASFWFECAEQPVFTHEWLHQVHWAYQSISGFADRYGWSLPACGLGDLDRHTWFPDSHQCNEDPDFERCGLDDCGGNDLVNAHILGVHWDPALDFIANHCKDGVQDYGETGVDAGGPCLGLKGLRIASTVTKRPPAPTFFTALPRR